jgi:hypothetical protein
MVLSAITFFTALITLKYGNMVTGVLCLLLYLSIIAAQRKQNPSLYWIFLIFNVRFPFLYTFSCISAL